MITAVQGDLTIGSESTLFTPTLVKSAINRARLKSEGLYPWVELNDAKKTSTVAGREYYDYPRGWRSNSIWKLTVDDQDYGDPLAFKDYLYEKENDYPSDLDYMWANQWRRYFIDPTPTTNGTNNIVVWGQMNGQTLVNDSDTTIFSYNQPECNEAIVLEAVEILKRKGGELREGTFLSAEAKQILGMAWERSKRETARHERTQSSFDVPDFFSGVSRIKQKIGNF